MKYSRDDLDNHLNIGGPTIVHFSSWEDARRFYWALQRRRRVVHAQVIISLGGTEVTISPRPNLELPDALVRPEA